MSALLDLARRLEALLEQSQRQLSAGDARTLAQTHAEKLETLGQLEAGLSAHSGAPQREVIAALDRIRILARQNEALLLAARAGMRQAVQRLEGLSADQSCVAYTADGGRRALAGQGAYAKKA